MARPRRKATCHPSRWHVGHGLCSRCYRNAYNATPEGRKRRQNWYLAHRQEHLARARAYWRRLHPEVKRVRGQRANDKAKALRAAQGRSRVVIKKSFYPISPDSAPQPDRNRAGAKAAKAESDSMLPALVTRGRETISKKGRIVTKEVYEGMGLGFPEPERETPAGFSDRDWWRLKPEDKPKHWL